MTYTDTWRSEYARLRAIAKQERRGNVPDGQSGGHSFEAARRYYKEMIGECIQRIREVDDLQMMANTELAQLVKEIIPREGYEPVAFFDGDEVYFQYEHGDSGAVIDIPWPFERDFVWPDDCKAAGIKVLS